MGNPPRIWLDYRPVRIGWVANDGDLAQITTAASLSACLWGGRFNPIIPMDDRSLSDNLIRLFRVDVLIPLVSTDATKVFVDSYPHLHFTMFQDGIFTDGKCEFVDIRHALKRILRRASSADGFFRSIAQPVWSPDDPLVPLLSVLLGHYPAAEDISIDYPRRVRAALEISEKPISENEALSPEWLKLVTPLGFTGFDLSHKRERSVWSNPGVFLGTAVDFDDLVLLWNLRAAGAAVCFYDVAYTTRLKPFVEAFLMSLREHPPEGCNEVNFWSRSADWPPVPWSTNLDVTGFQLRHCREHGGTIWNGGNMQPSRPQFSMWHRDVVPSFVEQTDRSFASFALPDRPFDDDDPPTLNQHFVVTVDADQYGSAMDDLTFTTPFIPKLNEFYGRNFYFEYDKARSEPGNFGHGAVGIITSLSSQRLQVGAIRVHQWLQKVFGLLGVAVERSEAGLRCARLIRQLGGLQGCRVLKVRGARELIREYGPDQNFTRSAAERRIGNFDHTTHRMRFSEFENLYVQPRERGKLTPGEVLQYMTARGVFRIGLDFKCPNCELPSWMPLDEVKTVSTCAYCGNPFDVTSQLKDRDWRYRRSGLFGRDDNQLGSIPVTLALQQLDISLHDSLLMCSTALEFRACPQLSQMTAAVR